MDGPLRLVEDRRLPVASTGAHPPSIDEDLIVLSSSPAPSKAPATPRSPDDSSEIMASSPQPSAQVPKKRKAVVVDSPSSHSNNDDLYVNDPKPKRSKAVTGSQKAAAAKSERKGKEVNVKGKGKEAVKKGKGKEREREKSVRTRQVKKTVKSVAFVEDEDSSSDDKSPPPTRPKPRPAYHGTRGLQGSVPESPQPQKDTSTAAPPAITTAPPHAASDPVSIRSAGPMADSLRDGHAKPGIERAAQAPAIPAVSAGEETHSMPIAPAVPIQGGVPAASEAQYPPHGPPPPLYAAYAADECNRYYHGRPPIRAPDMYSAQSPMLYQNPGLPRFPGDGEGPPERYGF